MGHVSVRVGGDQKREVDLLDLELQLEMCCQERCQKLNQSSPREQQVFYFLRPQSIPEALARTKYIVCLFLSTHRLVTKLNV